MADLKKVITEVIELYKDFPCLWDSSSESYKDSNQKNAAWKILAKKYREYESDANAMSTKKKIDNLKAAYKREVKKVQKSIRFASDASEVHKPNLWYFQLMTFLDKKDHQDEQQRSGNDNYYSSDDDFLESEKDDQSHTKKPRSSETKKHNILQELLQQKDNSYGPYELEESEQDVPIQKKKPRLTKTKTHNLIDTAQKLLQQQTSSFGQYVGEQLELISNTTYQRPIAEKLISDVIFMVKTGKLNINSRIETPTCSGCSTCLNKI